MPVITALQPQEKHPKRFNLYLDGKFALGVDEDLVVGRRLVKGKELSNLELEEVIFEAQVGKLMDKVYRLLKFRQRSEAELRGYFRTKNQEAKFKGKEEIGSLVIDATINYLKKKGLINDLEFTKSWVESRRRSKALGSRRLKLELFQKGISREIISQVLDSFEVKLLDESELARQALDKKIKNWSNLPALEFKKKALAFLLRRGFGFETAAGAVAKALKRE